MGIRLLKSESSRSRLHDEKIAPWRSPLRFALFVSAIVLLMAAWGLAGQAIDVQPGNKQILANHYPTSIALGLAIVWLVAVVWGWRAQRRQRRRSDPAGTNDPEGGTVLTTPIEYVTPPIPPQVLLGVEIRRLRMRLGVSQRHLVRVLGLQAHSNIGDYEKGRRIPPADIVDACERVLHAPPGYLQRLRADALADRARQWRRRELASQDDAGAQRGSLG